MIQVISGIINKLCIMFTFRYEGVSDHVIHIKFENLHYTKIQVLPEVNISITHPPLFTLTSLRCEICHCQNKNAKLIR